jgi:hypothetical protein
MTSISSNKIIETTNNEIKVLCHIILPPPFSMSRPIFLRRKKKERMLYIKGRE